MSATAQQLNDWAGRLFAIKNEMEEAAWVADIDVHQPEFISLAHLTWKAVHAEANRMSPGNGWEGVPPSVLQDIAREAGAL